MKPYLTISETCTILKVHRNTLSAMIRQGRIKAVNLNPDGRRPVWRVLADSLPLAEPTKKDLLWLDIRKRLGL